MTVFRPASTRLALVLGLSTGVALIGLGGRAEAQTAPAAPSAPAATTVPPAAAPGLPAAASTTTPAEVPAPGTKARPRHEAYHRQGGGMAGYLAALHDELQITPAEEPLWTSFATTMKQNSEALGRAYRQRREQLPSMNAVADMNSFIDIEQMRLDGLKKTSAAFEALYNTMPADQQKLADTIFLSDLPGGPHRHKPVSHETKPEGGAG